MKYRIFSVMMILAMVASLCVVATAPASAAAPGNTPDVNSVTPQNLKANVQSGYVIEIDANSSNIASGNDVALTFPAGVDISNLDLSTTTGGDVKYCDIDGTAATGAYVDGQILHLTAGAANTSATCEINISYSAGIINPQLSQEDGDGAPDSYYTLEVAIEGAKIGEGEFEIEDWAKASPKLLADGQETTVSGAGFHAGDTVHATGAVNGQGTVDTDGTFEFTAYGAGAGSTATLKDGTGRECDITGFVVTPRIEVSKTSGPVCTSFTVKGYDFNGPTVGTPNCALVSTGTWAIVPGNIQIGGDLLKTPAGVDVTQAYINTNYATLVKDLDNDGLCDDFSIDVKIDRMTASGPQTISCADVYLGAGTLVYAQTIEFNVDPRVVTVDPASGPPGTAVTIDGSGFCPGETIGKAVLVYGNTTATGDISQTAIEVDDAGNFSILGTIPEDASADLKGVIVFFDPTSPTVYNPTTGTCLAAQGMFTVTGRELTIIPDNGPFGTSIMISGGDFGSGINDGNTGPDLYINGTKDNDTNLAELSSSGDVIPKTIKVDADLNAANDGLGFNYGTNVIEVRVEDNDGDVMTASATFEITRPTLLLDMEQGPRGTLVTVEGDGWLPGDINFVTIKYTTVTEPTEQTIAVKNPDGAGHIWAQFKVPPFEMLGDEVNMQIWGTEGDNTSLKANFIVTTPTISVDPESAAAGEKVMVTGTGFQPLTQLQKLTIAGAYVSRIDTLPLTDAKGYFEVEGTVPGVMPGGQAVLALVTEGNPITCPFTVMAGAGGDISVEDGFATIDGKYTRVWTFDKKTKEWLVYDVDEGAPDQFDTLNRGQGYWVNVTEDCAIVYGAHTYDLITGWNLIGWQD